MAQPKTVPETNERPTVFERRGEPGVWSIERIDDDGGIEQAIFIGPDAERRCREYAGWRYPD
jgi:hypothetical protein